MVSDGAGSGRAASRKVRPRRKALAGVMALGRSPRPSPFITGDLGAL